MQAIGPGVREIRVRDASGAFRVIYVAAFAEAVYVLHAFAKKTRRTSQVTLRWPKRGSENLSAE
jgi:phage-related protein